MFILFSQVFMPILMIETNLRNIYFQDPIMGPLRLTLWTRHLRIIEKIYQVRRWDSSCLLFLKHDTIQFTLTVYCTIKRFLNQVFNKLINLLSESETCQGSGYILINSRDTCSSIRHRQLISVCVIWLTEGGTVVNCLTVSISHSWKLENECYYYVNVLSFFGSLWTGCGKVCFEQ